MLNPQEAVSSFLSLSSSPTVIITFRWTKLAIAETLERERIIGKVDIVLRLNIRRRSTPPSLCSSSIRINLRDLMEAKIGQFFDSIGSFFKGDDQIPWCDQDIIIVSANRVLVCQKRFLYEFYFSYGYLACIWFSGTCYSSFHKSWNICSCLAPASSLLSGLCCLDNYHLCLLERKAFWNEPLLLVVEEDWLLLHILGHI